MQYICNVKCKIPFNCTQSKSEFFDLRKMFIYDTYNSFSYTVDGKKSTCEVAKQQLSIR